MGYGASVHIGLHCRRSLPERWTGRRAKEHCWLLLRLKEARGRVMGQANVGLGCDIRPGYKGGGRQEHGKASAEKWPCPWPGGYGKASDSCPQKDHANGHFCLQ